MERSYRQYETKINLNYEANVMERENEENRGQIYEFQSCLSQYQLHQITHL